LIEIPDLFASVANCCDEELLQQHGSQKMLLNILDVANAFICDGIERVTALMEANWAGLLVRNLRASLDYPYLPICSIDSHLSKNLQACKIPFITAGVEEVLREVIKKYPSVAEEVNILSWIILKRLRKEDDDEESKSSWELFSSDNEDEWKDDELDA